MQGDLEVLKAHAFLLSAAPKGAFPGEIRPKDGRQNGEDGLQVKLLSHF